MELYRGVDQKVAEISIVSDTKIKVREVKGQRTPDVQGWVFNRFYDDNPTPVSVIIVEVEGKNAQIKTDFKLY